MRISDWSSDVCSSDLHRQRDAGVSGRRLDDGLARFQRAALLSVQHDRQGQAILYRTARVERFDLGVERDVLRGQALQLDDGCVADGVEDAVVKGHGSLRVWEGVMFRS